MLWGRGEVRLWTSVSSLIYVAELIGGEDAVQGFIKGVYEMRK